MMDFSGLLEPKFVELINKAVVMQLESGKRYIRALCNVANTRTTPKVQRISRKAAETLKKNGIEQKLAIVGANPMQRIIGNALQSGMHFAKSTDEALAWLTREP